VALTDAGQRLLLESRRERTAFLAQRLRELDADDRVTIEAALPALARLLEERAR
jgi:DNA-binding MarR family transcriptional regulator